MCFFVMVARSVYRVERRHTMFIDVSSQSTLTLTASINRNELELQNRLQLLEDGSAILGP